VIGWAISLELGEEEEQSVYPKEARQESEIG